MLMLAITDNGLTTWATVVDKCPGCGFYDIDLSPAAFSQLAPLGVGRIQVSWSI